jgi:hypothetical protein
MEVGPGAVDTMQPTAIRGDDPRHISMTSADITVFSSYLALGLSVLSLSAAWRVHRATSAAVRHMAEQCKASEAATAEQLHAAVSQMHRRVESTRVLSRASTLAEVDRQIESIASADWRLRAGMGQLGRAHSDAPLAGCGARQAPDDFALTEPMALDADVRFAQRPSHPARAPRGIAALHPEHA